MCQMLLHTGARLSGRIADPPCHHSEPHNVQRCAAEVSRAVPKSLQAALSAGEDTREGRRRLTKVEEKRILAPLLRLRQACCHPQVRSLDCQRASCCLLKRCGCDSEAMARKRAAAGSANESKEPGAPALPVPGWPPPAGATQTDEVGPCPGLICCPLLRLLLGVVSKGVIWLAQLRQDWDRTMPKACCRMQVGVGAIKSLAAQRAPMSMSSILEVREAITF